MNDSDAVFWETPSTKKINFNESEPLNASKSIENA